MTFSLLKATSRYHLPRCVPSQPSQTCSHTRAIGRRQYAPRIYPRVRPCPTVGQGNPRENPESYPSVFLTSDHWSARSRSPASPSRNDASSARWSPVEDLVRRLTKILLEHQQADERRSLYRSLRA